MAPRETENNAYAKFWRDKQRTLWYVMVFLEWSICLAVFFSLSESFAHTFPEGEGGGGVRAIVWENLVQTLIQILEI